MATLDEYRRKRDFGRTPEPSGEPAPWSNDEGGLFVVHKHAARRLHYDLRLEHEGVLESWALPKGPSLAPGEKRLAVRVEDHPLEYGDFEGVIPEGEYGAGTVMLWDRGRWREKRRSDGHIDFSLEGTKLRGSWSLVRMSGRAAEDGKNWLLIRRHDRSARGKGADPGPADGEDRSVSSGRTMEQIAADRDRTWTAQGEIDPAPMTPDPVVLSGARPGAMPTHPRPQLATLADRVPEGSGWIYEIKLDGYRILARIEDGAARLLSRNGRDWTDRFPETAAALARLPVSNALLDGEVVAMGADGVSSFRRLQEALSARRTAGLVYQVFDLLHIDGFDLTRVPLVERKETLSALLEAAGASAAGPLRFTDHIEGKGTQFLERVCRLGLEGIVCKRLDGPYREGRARQWIKVKCTRHEELVVGGYTDPGGARTGFGALLLGAWRDGRLRYAGKVGTGFSADQLTALHGRMRALEVDASPFDPAPQERGVHWVRPELVAEVEFTEWTRDGVLRHPSFRGLREDRDAEEIELPDPISAAPSTGPTRPGPAPRGTDAVVAGVRLSHPERVLFPDQGVTKLALAQYYEEIADWILPGLIGRPLSLVRCPQGHERQCFFQKHPGDTMKGLPRVEIQGKEGPEPYLYVRGLADLVALVQAGTLELHLWGSRVEDLERPDLLVFDLDPAPELPWGEVLRTARALGDRLAGLGLESFVRTTGGKGLHLVAPLIAGLGWDEVKAFARGVAQSQVRDDPRRLTINMSKSKRQGRIFLDYLRNGRGATAIASYSTRARQGAPVAVPVRWDELSPALRSDRYTVENLRRRLRALRADPWEGFEEARRPITPAMMDAVGASASGRGAGAGPTDPAEPS